MNDTLAQLMEESIKKVWSERNAARRMGALESIYAKDSTLFEVGEIITGYDAINDKVSKELILVHYQNLRNPKQRLEYFQD